MGDRNSHVRFEREILPHLDAAYNLARWLAGNDADAADVVQEASVRALSYFDSFRGGEPAPGFYASCGTLFIRGCGRTAARRPRRLMRPCTKRRLSRLEEPEPAPFSALTGAAPASHRGIARGVPGGAGAARDRGPVLQRDRPCSGRAHGHRDVAHRPRAQTATGSVIPGGLP